MNELETAYLQGVEDAREAILTELMMAEEAAAREEATIAEAMQVRAMQAQAMDLAALQEQELAAIETERALAAAYAAGASSAISPEDLDREEAYQTGVTIAETEALLEKLKAASGDMSDDLKANCDKGYEACSAVLAAAGEVEKKGASRRKSS